MKKYFKILALAFSVIVLSMSLSACSDDDDNPGIGSLNGTSWEIISNIDDSNGDVYDAGDVITFEEDGTVTIPKGTDYECAKWSLKGSTLRLEIEEYYYDDYYYTEGKFTVKGETAVYKYSLYESDATPWDESFTMTLRKLNTK